MAASLSMPRRIRFPSERAPSTTPLRAYYSLQFRSCSHRCPGGGLSGAQMPSETVILRLIDRNGRPAVKLAMSQRSAELGLVGDSDATHVVVKAATEVP